MLLAQLIDRLPPLTRAKVLLALLALIVLGLGLILLIVLGARYVRRLSRTEVAPTKPAKEDWFRKPLNTGWNQAGDNDEKCPEMPEK